MQSVKSYFNKTLYLHDIKRGWPIWVTYLVIWFFLLPFDAFSSYEYYTSVGRAEYFSMEHVLQTLNGASAVMSFVFAILAAMSLFHYLYQPRSANMLHALPLRREGHFLTHYAAGMSYFIIPNAVLAVLTLIGEMAIGSVDLGNIALWFVTNSLTMVFFFSLAVFCAQFTGHIIALPAFYAIWNFIVYGLCQIVSMISNLLLYGYNGDTTLSTIGVYGSPLLGIARGTGVHYDYTAYEPLITDGVASVNSMARVTFYGTGLIVIYAVVGVALTLAALAVYRRRNLETAGDVVAIPWAKPLFRYGLALFGGVLLGLLMCELFDQYGNLFFYCATVIWGVIAYFVAEMLLHKSFRVLKKGVKGAVGYALATLAVVLVFAFDLTGFETRVPAASQVAEVQINQLYTYPNDSYSYNRITLTDADIQALINIHQSVVDTRDDERSRYDNSRYFSLTYTMKNGSVMTREYQIPVDDSYLSNPEKPAAQLLALINDPQKLRVAFFPETVTTSDFIRGYATEMAHDDEGYRSNQTHEFTAEEAQLLYLAVCEDMANGRIGQRRFLRAHDYSYIELELVFYGNFDHWRWPDSEPQLKADSYSTTLVVEPSATATTAALNQILAGK